MSEWPRRAMLAASVSAGTLLLAGCYRVSPLVEGPRTGTTASTPTLSAAMRRAAELEADLAATASSLARTDHSHATALAAVAAVHSAHARTLGRADPFDATSTTVIDPVASSSATPRSATATPTRATLDRALAAAAKAHLASAVAATDPSHVLLWASLAASASASGLSPAPTVETTVSPVRIGSESLTAARQVLLSRVNALLAGLDWGVGRLLGVDQDLRAWGQERLDAVSTMRADLHAQIRESSATPTPFSPGYAMAATPSTPASTRSLWSALELGVLAGLGRVAAATPSGQRTDTVDALTDELTVLAGLGTGAPTWPGWA